MDPLINPLEKGCATLHELRGFPPSSMFGPQGSDRKLVRLNDLFDDHPLGGLFSYRGGMEHLTKLLGSPEATEPMELACLAYLRRDITSTREHLISAHGCAGMAVTDDLLSILRPILDEFADDNDLDNDDPVSGIPDSFV